MWNEGFNTKIKDVIQKLFDLRLKYKKQKNPLQNTIKTLLNSIYGKSIQKPTKNDTIFVKKCNLASKVMNYHDQITGIITNVRCNEKIRDEIEDYMKNVLKEDPIIDYIKKQLKKNNIERIIQYVKETRYDLLENVKFKGEAWKVKCGNIHIDELYSIIHKNESMSDCIVKVVKPLDKQFNIPHFGVFVLSWSKRIMNRVICTAQQNGIEIYYQDTDSVHLKEADVPKLQEVFKTKYNKELIGTNLGQFHCDFEEIDGKPTWSNGFIGCAKKIYLDVLTNGERNEDHMKMKGIPNETIKEYVEEHNLEEREGKKDDKYVKSIEDLYLKLYHGEAIEFNLVSQNHPRFRCSKTKLMYSLPSMLRTVQCK